MFTGRLSGGSRLMSWPRRAIVPAVGRSNPPIIRSVVVLPQPDGPSSEKNSPVWIVSETSSTATTSPKSLREVREANLGQGFRGVDGQTHDPPRVPY